MAIISKKKPSFPIQQELKDYLIRYNRGVSLPLSYEDLLNYENAIAYYDKNGEDTLWESVFFNHLDIQHIYDGLKYIYAQLHAGGDLKVIDHLYIDRIDLCVYGNTKPFRIRVVNKINDLFNYFYVKKVDASRVYGLELEHLLSPNSINFLIDETTLVEEHIHGIPGDQFMKNQIHAEDLNEIRLAKEFVKFNERCFVRLLGDMHSSNFVVEVIPDFDEMHYRIRAIDFDQQSYEGRRVIYMPQFFKQNNPIIQLGLKHMEPKLELQYQKEERARIARRVKTSHIRLKKLVKCMRNDRISTEENFKNLREELAEYYKDPVFLGCRNMGEILEESLRQLVKQPTRPR
ncbi:MAG: hypothetical protein MI784_07600 [Cytophagales bacterium]|nr:hypothetical protein [Cytophagales bacterium]